MPEHTWQALKKTNDLDRRVCTTCGLDDSKHAHKDWYFKLPCIEPPPPKVSFEALHEELKTHPARSHNGTNYLYAMRTFESRVICVGVPGKWRVGLAVASCSSPFQFNSSLDGSNRDRVYVDYEDGFSRLLRDLRARQYDPYVHSDLSYIEALNRPGYCIEDD